MTSMGEACVRLEYPNPPAGKELSLDLASLDFLFSHFPRISEQEWELIESKHIPIKEQFSVWGFCLFVSLNQNQRDIHWLWEEMRESI